MANHELLPNNSINNLNTRVTPWGQVTTLEERDRYRINRIEIHPGKHITTQFHYHRNEHWIVVSGTAKITFNGEERLLMAKQSTYVPMNTSHRLENAGLIPLVIIEIQNGEYIGDDDIHRLED
jgi:mannose-6-phosphate isomerase